ncbi:hypothetical protein EHE19_016410 [Ruminiclostridium herbifermentans]|uniref:ABC3 transporter permease C-terminal domain-containing protein n=1 Tax=Ruminiclostridium herbifermentans TaxID=2488810 RepID=A0A7H1VM15_9FIRM|nr:hypothetical protein EHE19_016410 [Ruminiclostridium herbifermentans]
MGSSKQQLKELAAVNSVYCRITNLNGTIETGLEIKEDIVDKIQSSSQVKDATFTVRLLAGEGEFPLEDWKEHLTLFITGINRISAISGLSEDKIHWKGKAEEKFFSSSVQGCLVSESTMEKYQWNLGDTISLNLYYQYYDERNQLHYKPLELMPIEILGTLDPFISTTEQVPSDILIPFDTIRECFSRKKSPFYADSCFFYVNDPLQLNKFKEEMKSIGLLQKSPTADYNYQGISLTVRDSTFRALGNQLLQSIDTLQSFLPLIGITIICIGYIASFLLINTRQREFALMRAIGVGRGMCFRLFLLEQLLLILVGEILGGGITFLLFRSSVTVAISGSIFFISYLLGCMFALWRMGRTSVINALFSMD